MSDYTLEGILKLTDKTGEATRSASKNVDGLKGALDAAKAALVTFGITKMAQVITNLAELGAAAQRTEYAFTNISGGEEIATENLEAMREATRGTISDLDAMRLSNRLLQMGLADNSEELKTLTEMSVRLGTAMGRDATEAVEEFSLLLANQSKLRLDTFGISVTGVEERIEKLKRTTRGLSDEEIFLQAVTEEGREAMDRLGPAIEDNQEQIDKAKAAWENFKTEAGLAFSVMAAFGGPLEKVFNWLTKQLEVVNDLTEKYGYFEARIRTMLQLLTLGAFSASNNTLFGQSLESPQQYYQNWYNQTVMPAAGGTQQPGSTTTQSVTMYNPQFVGVQSPTDMLEQLNRMSP